MKCEICGGDFKNIGVHQRFCGKTAKEPGIEIPVFETLKVDEFTEKPLSDLILKLKEVLRTYRYELDIRVSEKGGRVCEVEIRVGIQIT